MLAVLAADPDENIRRDAGSALRTQPLPAVLAALARRGGAPQMFAYCAAEFSRRPGIADALAKNPDCPIEVLRPVVRYLSVSAVQELFEDLDRLSTSPELVAALIGSTIINAEQRDQLRDLQREDLEAEGAFAAAVESAEKDNAQRETLMQKFSRMRVADRVQAAIKGNRESRVLLIRDPCKVVQRAVLQSPMLSDQEVEGFASMGSISDEILRIISGMRKYRKNYTVTRCLINNPKTPLDITLRMLPTIMPADLKSLTNNKNVSEPLRTAALRLQRQRSVRKE